MIELDPILLKFIDGNMITITFILALLKAFATATKWSEGNHIIEALQGLVSSFRGGGVKKVGKKK